MPANKSSAALELVDVSKSYGKVQALQQLSFVLQSGTCTGLLGPNGAGKTTACQIISGLLEPDSGEVIVAGFKYSKSRQKILTKIGVQLQESHFYGKFSVEETFKLFASFYPSSVDLDKLVSKLGLSEYSKKRLGQLSGGLKQRVYIGCALVHDPDFLILDEPMNNLDPISQQDVRELIGQLRSMGKTLLVSTHNIDESEKLCDKILIVDKGKLLCEGSPEELIRTLPGKEVLRFDIKDSASQLKLEKSLSWFPSTTNRQKRLVTNNAADYMKQITELSADVKADLSHLSLRPTNLEDVFFHVTGRSFCDQ
jgi:ABC-2 type transport system ATP-binding protein